MPIACFKKFFWSVKSRQIWVQLKPDDLSSWYLIFLHVYNTNTRIFKHRQLWVEPSWCLVFRNFHTQMAFIRCFHCYPVNFIPVKFYSQKLWIDRTICLDRAENHSLHDIEDMIWKNTNHSVENLFVEMKFRLRRVRASLVLNFRLPVLIAYSDFPDIH